MSKTSPRRRDLLTILTTLTLAILLLTVGSGTVAADTVVLDHFMYGNTNATLEFNHTNYSMSTELHIDIPRGAAVTDAQVSVRGIEGAGMANTSMDYSSHTVGPDMWAVSNADTGIVPLTVDPYNCSWDSIPSAQVTNISKVDGNYWHTETPSVPSTAPWEWPVQIYHFRPDVDDATRYDINWRGKGHCAANNTFTKYHSTMWLYNFDTDSWDETISIWDWLDEDHWMNETVLVGYLYSSANGSVVVAVSGVHADVNGTLKDEGHLYTDYISLTAVGSSTEDEYPEDVTLRVFDTYMRVADGPLSTTVTVDKEDGLATAIQDHIDHYPSQPGNVTVAIEVYVSRPTFARVEVLGLNITYDDSGVVPNDPPSWVGPASVNVMEDSGWKKVLDLDLAFTDDYDDADLQFSVLDISSAYLQARLGTGLLSHTWLEVKPADDFHGEVDVFLGASDLMGGSTEAPSLTVMVQSVPDAPFMLNPGVIPLNESQRLNITLLVLDPDMPGDTLTFSDTSDVFDVDPEEGTIDWTPGAEHIGTHSCVVTVEDSYGLTDRITLVIEVANVNDPPAITSDLVISVPEGETSVYTIVADDPDTVLGDVLAYTAWSLDLELDCNPTTGRVTFSTDKGRVGDLQAFVKVTDAAGIYDQRELTIRVTNVNDPPTIGEVGSQTHEQGEVVTFQLVVGDPDLELDLPEGEVLTLSAEGPEWLAPDADGWVNLTVEQHMVGDHLVRYTVTDREGLESSVSVFWYLEDVNDWPTIGTQVPATVTATEDEEKVLLLEADDVDGDALTWSDDTDLFDIGAGSGSIVFTPLQANVGTHPVTVTVSDGRGGTATVSFTVEVANVNDAPVIVEVRVGGELYDPTADIIILTPKNGETITVLATDEDGDDLVYRWLHEGVEVASSSELGYYGIEEGVYNGLKLVVDDGTESVEYTFGKVTVSSEDDDEGSGSLLVMVIVIAVICSATLGIIYFMRRPGE